MRHAIVASSSAVHGSGYLEYILDEIALLFKDTSSIVFIPYARPSGISHDAYTGIAAKAFAKINTTLIGLHTYDNPVEALKKAKGIFVGGGNTFVLLDQLYKRNLIPSLKQVLLEGTPYLGTSAGSNICGVSIKTTNDMPIVYPPSFDALGSIPFNINPHYLDPDPAHTHMGETRETRIQEFHEYNTTPVVGLREGSWLAVTPDDIVLKGAHSAKLFTPHTKPNDIPTGTSLKTLK